MKKFAFLLILGVTIVGSTIGCRGQRAKDVPPEKLTIEFDFFYRKDTTVAHSIKKKLKVDIDLEYGDVPEIDRNLPGKEADMGDFRVSIQPEINAFYIDVFEKGEKEIHVMRQLYQIHTGLRNQFAGSHGFTGLIYVNHSKSEAELQFCGSVGK